MKKLFAIVLLFAIVCMSLVALFAATNVFASQWEGPHDDWEAPADYNLTASNYNENTSVTVTVPTGDAIFVVEDADPKWLSCDPEQRESWLTFIHNGISDPAPLEDTSCPTRPEGDKIHVKNIRFTVPTSVTIACGQDSCYGMIYHRAVVETSTNTSTSTNTPTSTGTSENTNTPTSTGTSVTNTPTATSTPTITPTPQILWKIFLQFIADAVSTPTSTPTNTPTVTSTPEDTPTPETFHSCSRFDLHVWGGVTPSHGLYQLIEVPSGRLLMEWEAHHPQQDSGGDIGDAEGWTHFQISKELVWARATFTHLPDGPTIDLTFENHVPEHEQFLALWDGACHAAEVKFP